MLAFYDISNICNRCKKWKIFLFIEDIFQNIDKIVNGKNNNREGKKISQTSINFSKEILMIGIYYPTK